MGLVIFLSTVSYRSGTFTLGLVTDEDAKSWRSTSRYNALAAVPAGGLGGFFLGGILGWGVSGGFDFFEGAGGVIWFCYICGNLVWILFLRDLELCT